MTTILEEKYLESLTVAREVKGRHFSSTVNRAYYASVQCMLDVIFRRLKVSQEEFYVSRTQNNEGSHGWAYKLIAIEIAHVNKDDFKWFQRVFPQFKKLREKADYSQDKVTQDEAESSIKTAESIINVVKKQVKQK